MKTFRPKTIAELRNHVLSATPSIYLSSQTSTVIPFHQLEAIYQDLPNFTLCDLNNLPQNLAWIDDEYVQISGPVTWKQLKDFAITKNRRVMTMPTEELACILGGIATSCTGEHAFGYGTLRQQLQSITFMNHQGIEVQLLATDSIEKFFTNDATFTSIIHDYQTSWLPYESFKNAPFPRMKQAIDLMIGTEGQLGVITSAVIKTAPYENLQHFFITIPKWEDDYSSHFEILQAVQSFRGKILACELTDSHALSFLPQIDRSVTQDHQGDIIFLEVLESAIDDVYENLFSKFKLISEEQIFSITGSKFHQLRATIPRMINEFNAQNKVTKKATDVQVAISDFPQIMKLYLAWSKLNIAYTLFGHFGDAHLHFNFLPKQHEIALCQKELKNFYPQISLQPLSHVHQNDQALSASLNIKASPFAEHGIGLMKKDFIKNFYTQAQIDLFKKLKTYFDPLHQFFPRGFME